MYEERSLADKRSRAIAYSIRATCMV